MVEYVFFVFNRKMAWALGLYMLACGSLAQSVITANYCLDQLEKLQTKESGFYPVGTFPSQRYWLSAQGEEDNNVYCTASIAYVLRSVNERKPDDRAERLMNQATRSFENYRSRRGEAAYNFWQTIEEDLPFPNSSLLARERFRLPDDYGVSAMVQLARGRHPLDEPVRAKMVTYALRPERKSVAHFASDYGSKKVYEVWYADKMRQEMDIAVMANVLLFVLEKGFEQELPDRLTRQCLKTAITEAWYFADPTGFAQFHNSPAVILYHLARLVAKDNTGEFRNERPLLTGHLRKALGETEHGIEKIMIASSLLRLGERVSLTLSAEQLTTDASSFVFFSHRSSDLALRMLPGFYWRSEAVSWALVYEFLSFGESVKWEKATQSK